MASSAKTKLTGASESMKQVTLTTECPECESPDLVYLIEAHEYRCRECGYVWSSLDVCIENEE